MPTIRYDTLLVRAVSAELADLLRGARVRSVRFERAELRVRIALRMRDGARELVIHLAPDAGWLILEDGAGPRGNVDLPKNVRVADVTAPGDERVISIALGAPPHARLVIELLTNQWNAIAVAGDGRIIRALRPRRGARPFRPGLGYEPPPGTGRKGIGSPVTPDEWRTLLHATEPVQRSRAIVENVAYTSPMNVGWLLYGEGPETDAVQAEASYARYRELLAPGAGAALLPMPHGLQPYPHRLGRRDARDMPGLLPAFAAVAAMSSAGAAPDTQPSATPQGAEEAAARAQALADRLRRRVQRLQAELDGATEEAERLRGDADLLLAQLHRIERGAAAIELDDFAGGSRRIELDPALAAADNAQQLYAAAGKRKRAAERLPALIEAAIRNADLLDSWAAGVTAGHEDPAAPPVPLHGGSTKRKGAPAAPLLPYRVYRTSGGLEVRVGRSNRGNDELTLRHASPADIWLHARDVAGAHVVLRWPDATANPPQRDLAEAAALAALHSRARTSGLAAVDWTRRKYVRKRRKAPPGAVTLERANTVFVEPDPALLDRLSTDP